MPDDAMLLFCREENRALIYQRDLARYQFTSALSRIIDLELRLRAERATGLRLLDRLTKLEMERKAA